MNTNRLIQHLIALDLNLPVGAEDQEDWDPEFAELVEAAEDAFGSDLIEDLVTRLLRLRDAAAELVAP